MRVKDSHLPAVFAEAQRVREFLIKHCGGPDKIPVSLDDLTTAIKEIYGVEITVQLVPFNSKYLRGMIEIYSDGRAIITIDADLNTADMRYVFVKEACHIMLLNAENVTKDPGQVINYYVHTPPDKDSGSHPAEVVCEEITKYGAIELLFPPALRKQCKDEIAAKTGTLFTVGERLHLSANIVEFVLSDWYMDLSSRLRNDSPDKERFK